MDRKQIIEELKALDVKVSPVGKTTENLERILAEAKEPKLTPPAATPQELPA